jgi:hypothetical protein
MTAILAGLVAAYVAGNLLLYVAAVIDADNTRTVPVYVPPADSTVHPCWAEYDPEQLRKAALDVAIEMAHIRLYIGHRELVAA